MFRKCLIILFVFIYNVLSLNAQKQNPAKKEPQNNITVNKNVKINPAVIKEVNNLKLLGKSDIQIVKVLKSKNTPAFEVFRVFKKSSADADNVGALCSAGYNVEEILTALKSEGYAPLSAVDLIKNSTGCSFERMQIFRQLKFVYGRDIVWKGDSSIAGIMMKLYTTDAADIISVIKELYPDHEYVINTLWYNRIVNDVPTLCRLLNGQLIHFDRFHLHTVILSLLRIVAIGGDEMRLLTVARGLLAMGCTETEAADGIYSSYFSSGVSGDIAIRLARITHGLGLSRENTAAFLRSKSFSATLVLNALREVYGS